MSSSDLFQLVAGIVVALLSIPLLTFLLRTFTIQVEDEEAVLVTSFGKLVKTLREPGLNVYPGEDAAVERTHARVAAS